MNGARPVIAADPFNIDVVLPLTGPAAFLGKAEQLSLQQAEKILAKGDGIGGRPIKFVFHDDQSNPQTAVQLANQIVAAKPAVVLGSAVVAMREGPSETILLMEQAWLGQPIYYRLITNGFSMTGRPVPPRLTVMALLLA